MLLLFGGPFNIIIDYLVQLPNLWTCGWKVLTRQCLSYKPTTNLFFDWSFYLNLSSLNLEVLSNFEPKGKCPKCPHLTN